MAAKKASADAGVNKSEFSRELLTKDPTITAKTAAEAWVSAGHASDDDTIKKFKQSFTNFKSTFGKKSSKPKGKPGRKPGKAAPVAASNGAHSGYDGIEVDLDHAIMKALALSDDGLASALRIVRREVIKKSL